MPKITFSSYRFNPPDISEDAFYKMKKLIRDNPSIVLSKPYDDHHKSEKDKLYKEFITAIKISLVTAILSLTIAFIFDALVSLSPLFGTMSILALVILLMATCLPFYAYYSYSLSSAFLEGYEAEKDAFFSRLRKEVLESSDFETFKKKRADVGFVNRGFFPVNQPYNQKNLFEKAICWISLVFQLAGSVIFMLIIAGFSTLFFLAFLSNYLANEALNVIGVVFFVSLLLFFGKNIISNLFKEISKLK